MLDKEKKYREYNEVREGFYALLISVAILIFIINFVVFIVSGAYAGLEAAVSAIPYTTITVFFLLLPTIIVEYILVRESKKEYIEVCKNSNKDVFKKYSISEKYL